MLPHLNSVLFKLSKFLCFAFLSIWVCNVYAQKTTKYTYDVLGRLTFVEDSQNGNRDYDYDRAGNRLLVTTGEVSDTAAEPGSPDAPSGLLASLIADCAWKAQWSAVPDATSYVFRSTLGIETTTTSLSATINCTVGNPNSNKPYWVRACNAVGCGQKAYF